MSSWAWAASRPRLLKGRSHLGNVDRMVRLCMAVANACMKGIVYPLGICFLSQSQSTLMPKPDVNLGQPAQWPSCIRTCGRENHKGYLRRHVHEVRHLNNASPPISVPLDEIPENNLDC